MGGGLKEAASTLRREGKKPVAAGSCAVDRPMSRLYIAHGVASRTRPAAKTMAEPQKERLDIAALEARVDELIRTVETLANENEALRSQQTVLAAERATLIDKTEQARTRVEAMIARLKAMESR